MFDVVARNGFALVALLVLAVGFALGLLPRSRPPRGLWISIAGLAALGALTAISMAWAPSAEQSYAELTRIIQLAVVLAMAWLLLDRHTWTAAVGGLTAGALLVSALAVGSRLFPDLLSVDLPLERLPATMTRLSYPLDYWNAVGSWAAMSIVMGLAWSAHANRAWVRSAALALVPVAGLAIYLTFSRWALVSLLTGLLVVIAASRHRWSAALNLTVAGAASAAAILVARAHPEIYNGTGDAGAGVVFFTLVAAGAVCAAVAWHGAIGGADRWRLPAPLARGAAGLAALLALALVVAAFATGVVDRAWDEFSAGPQTGLRGDPESRLVTLSGTRSIVYESALDAFESEPIRGIGPGGFAAWWRQEGEGREVLVDAHSLYLEQLAELGLPGLVAILVFLGGCAVLIVRARSNARTARRAGAAAAGSAAFAVYAVHAGFDWIWEYPALGIIGLGAGAAVIMGLASPRPTPLRDGRRRAVAVAVVSVALVIQLPGYLSTLAERDSMQALARGDLAEALSRADDAVSYQPWAASPRAQRGLVQEARGALVSAASSYREAIDRDPGGWRYQLQLARTEAKRGNIPSAVRAMAAGRRLNPRSIVADEEIARLRRLIVSAAS